MAKRKVNLGGREFMGEAIPFEAERPENWNQYILEDGTELKVKVVVAEVVRLEDENGNFLYQPNGEPTYAVTASTIVNSVAPDKLKQRKG